MGFIKMGAYRFNAEVCMCCHYACKILESLSLKC